MIAAILPTTGNSLLDGIIYAGAVIGAWAVIWRKGIRPIYRAANLVITFAPVWLDMSKQFKSNSGSTLKDVVLRLEAAAKENLEAIDAVKTAIDVIKARNRPFIFATGYGSSGLPEEYRDRPALQKPFQIETLGKAIDSALRSGAT